MKELRAIDPSSLRASLSNKGEDKALADSLVSVIKRGDKSYTEGLIKSIQLSTLLRLRFTFSVRVIKAKHRYLETGEHAQKEFEMAMYPQKSTLSAHINSYFCLSSRVLNACNLLPNGWI